MSHTHPSASRDGFLITTDPARLQLEVIHRFLSGSYWARDIPRDVVQRSLENSLCFGIYDESRMGEQVGFARVVTDRATFAYLGDVFVLESYRGHGLSKWMMRFIHAHPDLQGLRRWCLVTADAHGLYEQMGWRPIAGPEAWMEIHDGDVYRRREEG